LVRELERVGQQVLDDLLKRLTSVTMSWQRGLGDDAELDMLGLGDVAEAAVDRALQVSRRSSLTSTATVPDSIFDRSRMSLMSISRSLPDRWIVFANSTCFGLKLLRCSSTAGPTG